MKSFWLYFLLLLLVSTNYVIAQKRVLFVGNSYTAANNLPQMLSDLADSMGDSIVFASNTPGGYTFQLHSSDANTLGLIQSQPWDYVVLQEQSQRPSFPQSQVNVEVYPYAQQLDSLIRLNNSCTETVFYMTWGRKYGDASNCATWPPVCTYSGMQEQLRLSYLNMGNDNNALVAPCGIAWQQSVSIDSTINLWVSDNSHPSLEGTYLNACVFYATLFRRSPIGAAFTAGLSVSVSSHLQQVAHQTVFDSLSVWNIGDFDAKADFIMQPSGLAVQFLNISLNATSASWDFGDGQSSTLVSPQHTYAQPGNYVVQLISGNACMQDTLSDTLALNSSGLGSTNTAAACIESVPGGLLFHCDALDVVAYAADGRLIARQATGLMAGETIQFSNMNGAHVLVITFANKHQLTYRLMNIR
ncbi:MAG: PKD domain-containing protein [Bacteroidota bacterium]|jgi:hypothetical protein